MLDKQEKFAYKNINIDIITSILTTATAIEIYKALDFLVFFLVFFAPIKEPAAPGANSGDESICFNFLVSFA